MGREIALGLARAGARVACAARTRFEIEAAAAECGPGAVAIELDVTSPERVNAAVAAAQAALGGIDILVNNAGAATSQPFRNLDLKTWRRVMATDLEGPFLVTQAVLPDMLGRDYGRVIMIGSMLSCAGRPYVAAYAAAKHGLLGLTRSLAAEYARSAVTFNCVCPAYAATPMTQASIANIVRVTGRSEQEARRSLHTPQDRLIEPAEVAAACVFLASALSGSITGQALMLDGGEIQA